MTFTAGQIFAFVVAVVGLVLTVLNIYDKISSIKKAATAPLCELEKRVDILEMKQIQNEARFAKGDEHFDVQAGYNKMFMQVQLAFVDFSLAFCKHTNYPNTENIEKTKQMIQDALTDAIK